jgi:hypothetical protein
MSRENDVASVAKVDRCCAVLHGLRRPLDGLEVPLPVGPLAAVNSGRQCIGRTASPRFERSRSRSLSRGEGKWGTAERFPSS